jgi:hypothetical protein
VLDPLDGIDRLLDLLGDLALHGFRGGARVDGVHEHDRELDVRELVDVELTVGSEAEDGQGHHHHGGEDRLLDREVAEEHGPTEAKGRGCRSRRSGSRPGRRCRAPWRD